MRKLLSQFFLPLLLSFASVPSSQTLARPSTVASVVDDEYDRYKKRGDDFFKAGSYLEAKRQYQNCLEVPGFENDAYAKKKVEDCTAGITLRQKAEESMRKGHNPQTLALLNQLKDLNPDPITFGQLADYYEFEGNQLFNRKDLWKARTNYVEAKNYASDVKKGSLDIQIKHLDDLLKPKKQIGLKAAVGMVAVGAGAFGVLLRQDYTSKLNKLNQISQSADPNNTGIIDDPALYDQYNVAYQNAEAAKKKISLSTACLGVAAVAVLAEAYLLVHKPKPRAVGFTIHSASQSWGLAIRYTF